MKDRIIKAVSHRMTTKMYDELLELAYKKGFQTITEFWNHIFREYVEKESKKQ